MKSFKKLGGKIKAKVIDKTSDLLSAPAVFISNRKIAQGNRDLATIKEVRKYPKSANSFGPDGVTPAGRARAAYEEVKMRLTPKKKKNR